MIDVPGHDHFRETHFYEDTRLSLNKLYPNFTNQWPYTRKYNNEAKLISSLNFYLHTL